MLSGFSLCHSGSRLAGQWWLVPRSIAVKFGVTQWVSATGKLLRLEKGDITRVAADAIVNAANSALAGGGGVDGAIHRAGGPAIMRELDAIRAREAGCPTGSAVATGAGKLPAKYV